VSASSVAVGVGPPPCGTGAHAGGRAAMARPTVALRPHQGPDHGAAVAATGRIVVDTGGSVMAAIDAARDASAAAGSRRTDGTRTGLRGGEGPGAFARPSAGLTARDWRPSSPSGSTSVQGRLAAVAAAAGRALCGRSGAGVRRRGDIARA
jgi:hypothetical protein